MTASELGVTLQNGCRITHGSGSNIKRPFPDIDLTMHELSAGSSTTFRGQFGFIQFTTELRLPRHVHMDKAQRNLVTERILVLHGVGLVELNGKVYVVGPGSLVDIKGGVPHTWTACPKQVLLPDGTVSDGTFTMVYEYEEVTAFFSTASIDTVTNVSEYRAYEGSLEDIRFPKMSAQEVVETATLIWGSEQGSLYVA